MSYAVTKLVLSPEAANRNAQHRLGRSGTLIAPSNNDPVADYINAVTARTCRCPREPQAEAMHDPRRETHAMIGRDVEPCWSDDHQTGADVDRLRQLADARERLLMATGLAAVL